MTTGIVSINVASIQHHGNSLSSTVTEHHDPMYLECGVGVAKRKPQRDLVLEAVMQDHPLLPGGRKDIYVHACTTITVGEGLLGGGALTWSCPT